MLSNQTVGGPLFGALYELDDFECEVHFLKNDTLVVEVIHLTSPAPKAGSGRAPWTSPGTDGSCSASMTPTRWPHAWHFLGGRVLEHTRTQAVSPDGLKQTFLVCLDPDGNRIHLMEGELPDAVR
ncbi:hypothetical protein OG866_00980 [Streptomyces sp. NBC_00663]|uniref:hypothetical protein n=1 Tax=Streptomyces sp. NBC_00663 TaxID=2975801 RepID=UPI002E37705B|nr:hypothetical protein [Streptomyces sp. NBC_00663]